MKRKREIVLVANAKVMVFDTCENRRPRRNLSEGSCSVGLRSWKRMAHKIFHKTTLYPDLLQLLQKA